MDRTASEPIEQTHARNSRRFVALTKVKSQRLIDVIISAGIFVCTFLVFWFSPVHQVTDSKYSMLLSECLIRYRSFSLDHFQVPRLEPVHRSDYVMNGGIYQLEIVNNRIYYFFPPGTSVLSVPLVAVANALGVSAANSDGTPDLRGEMRIELAIAALLMGVLAACLFLTCRLILPLSWSVLIALSGSFGTQIWSTASRGLWSHTWSVLLTGLIVYLLLASEVKKRMLHPILLATLLSWMYFVRPGNSVQVICVVAFVGLYYRKLLLPFVMTGAVWLLLFVVYSLYNFGHVLPNYYRASRLDFAIFPLAFMGNLISPARGLLIYVPAVVFIAWLLVRYWHYIPVPRLTRLALAVSVGNLLIVSCFAHWWGGASFGPRFMTDVVPWFVLLAAVGICGMLAYRESHAGSTLRSLAELVTGAILVAASIFINGRGALAVETWRWNPGDVSQVRDKLWDWRRPQFLAGLVAPPLNHGYPDVIHGRRVDFTRPEESAQFVWYGWSDPEESLRWTEGKAATLIFATDEKNDLTLRMKILPFVRERKWPQQRIITKLNGNVIDSYLLTENRDTELAIHLPGNLLRPQNVLEFKLPDAASPELLDISSDQRLLGFAVYWIEFETGSHQLSATTFK